MKNEEPKKKPDIKPEPKPVKLEVSLKQLKQLQEAATLIQSLKPPSDEEELPADKEELTPEPDEDD